MLLFDLRKFDIYRKVPKDLTEPTVTGAIVSIVCVISIAFLLISEFASFISTDLESELYVENPNPSMVGSGYSSSDSDDKIPVFLNISLPRLPCAYVGLDIQDDMGRHEVGHIEDTVKVELNGGAGCRFEGRFSINRVPGNFHVSTHSAQKQPKDIDMAHYIHSLTFGDDVSGLGLPGGGFNSLAGKDKITANGLESHEYHMKIVPTKYEDLSGRVTTSFQYTVAYKNFVAFSHTGKITSAVWFKYDLNPITVKYTKRRKPLYSFLTMVAAIVGGVFTVAGIVDSLIFSASNILKKMELGKLN